MKSMRGFDLHGPVNRAGPLRDERLVDIVEAVGDGRDALECWVALAAVVVDLENLEDTAYLSMGVWPFALINAQSLLKPAPKR
jgi:hypothetical protein